MHKFFIILFIIATITLSCQKKNPYIINKPECVVWNPITRTYLISNAGSGIILSLKNKFTFKVFNKTQLVSPKGMKIQGNTLFVTDINRLVGLNTQTGKKTYEYKFAQDAFLNDVETSADNMVYISDTNKNNIVMMNLQDRKPDFFTHKELSKPNGLYYVKGDSSGLLYIVSFRKEAPVQVLNLTSRELFSIPNSAVSMADGIARQNDGTWLISSWADSTIYKFSPDFSVKSALRGKFSTPADFFLNIPKVELAIPMFETNQISFVTKTETTIVENN